MILKQPDNHSERYLQRALHAATGLLRWIVPDSAAVAHATRLEDQDVQSELPDELKDPFAVFDRDPQNCPPAILHSRDGQDTVEALNLLSEKNINAE